MSAGLPETQPAPAEGHASGVVGVDAEEDRRRLRRCTLTDVGRARVATLAAKAFELSIPERGLHRLDRQDDLMRVLHAVDGFSDDDSVRGARIVFLLLELGR